MSDNQSIEIKYKIDTSILTVGQTFQNKRVMSEYLGQPYIPNKTASLSQTKEWKRYIDWETDGRKIIITKIHPTPLDKNDGRAINGTNKYQKLIEDIILAYIDSVVSKNKVFNDIKDDSVEISLTLNQIMYICGMVNEKYINVNIRPTLVDMGYTTFNINDFFTRTKSKFRAIIDNALLNMNKRNVIHYKKNAVIIDTEKHRLATEQEEEFVTSIEKRVLSDMECDSVISVLLSHNTEDYHKRINQYLKDEFGWQGVYRCYTITINRSRINLEKEYLKNIKQDNKFELNKRLVEFFNQQITNKLLENKNEKNGGFVLPCDYETQQLNLINELLSI